MEETPARSRLAIPWVAGPAGSCDAAVPRAGRPGQPRHPGFGKVVHAERTDNPGRSARRPGMASFSCVRRHVRASFSLCWAAKRLGRWAWSKELERRASGSVLSTSFQGVMDRVSWSGSADRR